MSIESVLKRGREVRPDMMRSTVRVERPLETAVFDPETGEYIGVSPEVLYEGMCHFKSWSPMGWYVGNVAERPYSAGLYEIILPWDDDGTEAHAGDYATILTSGDEWVIGTKLEVYYTEYSNDRTARHITVIDQDLGSVTHG